MSPQLVQDSKCPVALFYADDGERIGTYTGHQGAVFCLDVTSTLLSTDAGSEPCSRTHSTYSRSIIYSGDSKWLLTAGADSSVRLWDVEKGTELYTWTTHQPAKACAFAQADQRLAVFTTGAFATSMPSIRFIRIADVPGESKQSPILQIDLERTQTCVLKNDCDA